jgi:transposase InsO family protein
MEEHRPGEASGTERREERSDDRSGVPDAFAPGAREVPGAEGLNELGQVGTWLESAGARSGPATERSPASVLLPDRKAGPAVNRALHKPPTGPVISVTPEQRLLLLDVWKRSGLSAGEFGTLVGLSKQALCDWKRRFDQLGPEGLLDKPRGAPKGTRVAEVTRRTILMIKEANPEYGCQRISDMLLRGPGLPASAGAVANVLRDAGYEMEEVPTRSHEETVRRFERARPNQLWQTDLFTFMLRRQNRRVYLVAFLDDHSRFVVSYGLYASPTAALVIETLRAGILNFGCPEEVLTDNGPQYASWRGKSAFRKELDKLGVKHILAHPKHPQTVGKAERFWGTLWRECVETAVFFNVDEARQRIGLFIDHYNFHRPHQGIDGLVPADRYFGAAPEVLRTLRERVAKNALELARKGVPREPLYVTGQMGGKSFSVHAAGERVFLTREGEERREIELGGPVSSPESTELPKAVTPTAEPRDPNEAGSEEPGAPGTSPLDELGEIGGGNGKGGEE